MALSMNFAEAADRSTSTQHEILALFSNSITLSPQATSNMKQIFHLDGRSFHPVSQHEIGDDVLTSADPEWDLPMELEPIPLASPFFPQPQGMDDSGTTTSSSPRNAHITESEGSETESVSSNIFDEVSVNGDANATPVSFPMTFPPNGGWQQPKRHRQVTEPSVSPGSICDSINHTDQQQGSCEEEQTLTDVIAAQDHRFKPFHEEKWNQRYKELLVFHEQHGHVAVPHTYPPNQQLARWIKRQRRQYKLLQEGKQATLTPERLDMLNSLGFVWDSHDVNWREKYQMLVEYKDKNGDCNVPSNHKDKKLATWVKCQRRQHKLYIDKRGSSMTPERIADLDKIGFNWEIRHVVPKKATPVINKIGKNLESSRNTVTLQNIPGRQVRMVPPSA